MVDPGGGEAEPRGELQEVRKHGFVQFQVAQLALAAKGAQVDLVRGEVFGEAVERANIVVI